MTWALQRQLFYLGILSFVFLLLGFLIGYPYFNPEPTCFDGKQSGDELGVDCGGSCVLACISQVDKISILWARAFQVVPGRYNAVAYIENHNEKEAVDRIRYRFRFADENNVYIGMREGEIFIPPAGNFAIFEPAVGFGNSVPVYTTFEFLETPTWYQVPNETLNQARIFVSDIVLFDEKVAPRMTALVSNDSLYAVEDIYLVAILYDEFGNALQTSRTYIEELAGEDSREIVFTWPEPIDREVITKEIIPMYNISSIKFQ